MDIINQYAQIALQSGQKVDQPDERRTDGKPEGIENMHQKYKFTI